LSYPRFHGCGGGGAADTLHAVAAAGSKGVAGR